MLKIMMEVYTIFLIYLYVNKLFIYHNIYADILIQRGNNIILQTTLLLLTNISLIHCSTTKLLNTYKKCMSLGQIKLVTATAI